MAALFSSDGAMKGKREGLRRERERTSNGDGGIVISGVSYLVTKWFRLARNGTDPRLFQIRFQYILAPRAKMY